MLACQRSGKYLGDLRFVLDDENPHPGAMLPGQAGAVPDFCVRHGHLSLRLERHRQQGQERASGRIRVAAAEEFLNIL